MTSEGARRRIGAFGRAADEYRAGRPDCPRAAVGYAAEGRARAIEIAAGTGKLTAMLAPLVSALVVTEPQHEMLLRLRADRSDIPAVGAVAEALPVRSGWADLVVAAQAFHWFDRERAVPEIARVLGRRGRLALLWNVRDERVGWIGELTRITGPDNSRSTRQELRALPGFEEFTVRRFEVAQEMDRARLVAHVKSRSNVAALDPRAREEMVEKIDRLCDDHPEVKGRARFTMRYVTEVYRATKL